MSSRRKLFMFPAFGLVAALIWTAVGTFSSASGQTQPTVIARAHSGEHAPSYNQPIFILMLGGDLRNGNDSHTRTDSIHIVAIDPTTLHASILGIPRDSFVNIPGHGNDKINDANEFGGPPLAIATVEALTGCKFAYYTLTSFRGFVSVVNQFGGIDFTVTEHTKPDHYSHYNFSPGPYHFNGTQALAFARDRHTRPAGDFDRSLAQGKLIVAALAQQRKNSAKDPGTILRALGAMYRNLKLNIPITEALKLGIVALKINPRNVTNAVMKGGFGTGPGGSSIVTVTPASRNQFVDICSDGQLGNG
jgi:polyisoprenyl-teichoic acid--peptidoglycan teichoic acid transferase